MTFDRQISLSYQQVRPLIWSMMFQGQLSQLAFLICIIYVLHKHKIIALYMYIYIYILDLEQQLLSQNDGLQTVNVSLSRFFLHFQNISLLRITFFSKILCHVIFQFSLKFYLFFHSSYTNNMFPIVHSYPFFPTRSLLPESPPPTCMSYFSFFIDQFGYLKILFMYIL